MVLTIKNCDTVHGIILFHSSAKSIKLHLYWAMKNCGNDPEVLKDMIDNIVCHYIVSMSSNSVHLSFHCILRVTIRDVSTIPLAKERDMRPAKLVW